MLERPDLTLVIGDGDLSGLVASFAAREAYVAWLHAGPDREGSARPPAPLVLCVGDAARHSAAAAAAKAASLDVTDPDENLAVLERADDTILLISAVRTAIRAGRTAVVWPVQFESGDGPDIQRVSQAIDRALLVTRLSALDAAEHARPNIHVETPYVDFTDAQMVELAIDLAVPIELCWWWSATSGEAARARQRWMTSLTRAGWRTPGRT